MLINLSDILSVPEKVEHLQVEIDMDEIVLNNESYIIVKKAPIELMISVEGIKKAHIESKTKLSLSIPCSRCLEEVIYNFDINISKYIDFNQSEEDRIQELDETNYIDGYELDVDKLIYNEILIDFPMKVLCKSDCKGICDQCGTNLNQTTCNCNTEKLDPRMSVIQDIFKNFKEV